MMMDLGAYNIEFNYQFSLSSVIFESINL